ncbi:MAG: hemerythrin domain-containing protein [Thermoflavifilum sp.]|nr:hemerythrin domain-containing protein [Thermoflavifilum sp.]MCL6513500.1 hemerythrin domain-containing protein [Alicyclobacillus sp.]
MAQEGVTWRTTTLSYTVDNRHESTLATRGGHAMQRFTLEFRHKPVQSLFQRGQSKFVQLSLEPGQGLTRHRVALTLAVVVVSGRIRFTAEGRDEVLGMGDVLVLDPDVEHAVQAVERSVVLLVLVPDQGAEVRPQPTMKLDHPNAFQNPELMDQIAPELRPLVEDHLHVCKVLESVNTSMAPPTVKNALSVIGEEIAHHFVAEEQILFPRMAQHVGGMDVGPVARLLEEHHHIRQLHQEAESLLDAWQSGGDEHTWTLLTNKLTELAPALLNHLGKEDSHLFPMASRLLTPQEKSVIAEELKAITPRP